MWTALLVLAMGIGVIMSIMGRNAKKPQAIPRPARQSPAARAAGNEGTFLQQAKEKSWKKIKENWKHALPSLGLIFLLNFLLYASMNEKNPAIQGENGIMGGGNYFVDSYLWSRYFWVLCVVIVAVYLQSISEKQTKGFKPFTWAATGLFLICVWKGILPGYTGGKSLSELFPQTASASSNAAPEPIAQVIESVSQEDGHLSDRFPLSPEVDSLIDATFSKHSDSLRKVMKDIAVAESGGKQFEDGTTHVLQGKVNGRDLGLFQINDTLHGKTCLNAGFDITEIEGNAKCAELLLTRRGTTNDWCASAWKWRDGYESKPQYWTCDRTPAQLLAGTDPRGPHGDELIVADAPADSSWSQPVYTYGRETRWSAPPGVDIQILTPDGTIREQLQGQNLPNFPNVRFVRFRVKVGTGAEFSPITIVRSGN